MFTLSWVAPHKNWYKFSDQKHGKFEQELKVFRKKVKVKNWEQNWLHSMKLVEKEQKEPK